jgi:hypothetical protein
MVVVSAVYPVRLEGTLDASVSRWIWIFKFLLVVPHLLILLLLRVASLLVTVVAFFAILITARYPRPLFDFNVGVMRWSWRVLFYSYGLLGTDKYPPFTLGEAPGYPARLEVDYPERLSRGLVLVKFWLLVFPHALVLYALLGGQGAWNAGVAGLLVFYAGVSMLFTTRYPKGIFDLLMGIHRWSVRVQLYASLMTDVYPPFRLDQGTSEPTPLPTSTPSV